MSAFIDEHRERFGVEPICRVLDVSASAYYHRARGELSARRREDERLLEVIRATHKQNYEAYGYRRTWKALLRAGERVPRCQVQRLMRAHGIQGAKRRGKPWRTTKPDPNAQRRPDLVERNFTAAEPNRLWVGDLSYLRCWEGVVYFAFIIDVFSRRVVGWQLASHMRTDLVLDALRMALGTREHGADFRLVAHTDRGSQYTSTGLHPGTRRSPRAGVRRIGRRRLRQRPGRIFRGLVQDRADRRSRLAHPRPVRTRRRRVHSLGSTTTACTNPSATSRPSSSRLSTPGGPRQSLNEQQSKPTNPVSAEPGPAQSARAGCLVRLPALTLARGRADPISMTLPCRRPRTRDVAL